MQCNTRDTFKQLISNKYDSIEQLPAILACIGSALTKRPTPDWQVARLMLHCRNTLHALLMISGLAGARVATVLSAPYNMGTLKNSAARPAGCLMAHLRASTYAITLIVHVPICSASLLQLLPSRAPVPESSFQLTLAKLLREQWVGEPAENNQKRKRKSRCAGQLSKQPRAVARC